MTKPSPIRGFSFFRLPPEAWAKSLEAWAKSLIQQIHSSATYVAERCHALMACQLLPQRQSKNSQAIEGDGRNSQRTKTKNLNGQHQSHQNSRQRVLNSKPRATPYPTPKKRTAARYASLAFASPSFARLSPRAAPALVLLVSMGHGAATAWMTALVLEAALGLLTGLGLAAPGAAGVHGPWRCYGLDDRLGAGAAYRPGYG